MFISVNKIPNCKMTIIYNECHHDLIHAGLVTKLLELQLLLARQKKFLVLCLLLVTIGRY